MAERNSTASPSTINTLTPSEIRIVQAYRGMPEQDKAFIERLAAALHEDADAIPKPKLLVAVGGRAA